MKLKYSESHPLTPKETNEQFLTKVEFIEKFNNFEWEKFLEQQLNAKNNKIYCSPSLNIADEDSKGISVSIVGDLDDFEFYICYKRPKIRKKRLFGLIKYNYFDKNFCDVFTEKSKQDSLDAFLLFYDQNFEELEKIK